MNVTIFSRSLGQKGNTIELGVIKILILSDGLRRYNMSISIWFSLT